MPSMRGSIENRLREVTPNGGQVIGFQPDAVSQRLIITRSTRVSALRASSTGWLSRLQRMMANIIHTLSVSTV